MKIWFECTGVAIGVEPTLLEWGGAIRRHLGSNDQLVFAVNRADVASATPGYSAREHPDSAIEYDTQCLKTRLMEVRPDIIHCHGARQLRRVMRIRYPGGKQPQIIITMHSFRHGTPLRPVAAIWDGILFRAGRKFVTPHFLSTRSLDEFYRGLPLLPRLSRCNVFPLGVSEPVLAKGNEGNNDALFNRLAGMAVPRVIYLADFRPVKRHMYLLSELRPLLEKNKCVLVLCGAGSEAFRVRRAADDWGIGERVIMTGRLPREDVVRCLQVCQLGVCSSVSENSPRCVAEPLSVGLPVVTTDVGSASVYVRDFVNGFLIPRCAGAGMLRDKVSLLLSDQTLYTQMALRTQASVFPECSWSECARRTVCMYCESLRA